ncbi:MAG: tetratricopeptide repeat protein [Alphaproteobacteria bacterium]|uniref:Tetratricopeptide repeat protein n=1 Tax=Candidatus Nitrobium versatile TaxID=2884831 RepID=A0A953JAU1_9BACT|nr:tetratricopeptide repeat protein [Candidatus Nitrobium versatile]
METRLLPICLLFLALLPAFSRSALAGSAPEAPDPASRELQIPSPPLSPAAMYFRLGVSLSDEKRHREAIQAFGEAVRLKPGFVDAHVRLGIEYYRLGRYREAADSYRQALAIAPELVSLYNKLGTAYIMLGDYPSATDIFIQALRRDPDNPAMHFNLGIVHFLRGDKAAAEREYGILKNLDREYAERLFDLIYP